MFFHPIDTSKEITRVIKFSDRTGLWTYKYGTQKEKVYVEMRERAANPNEIWEMLQEEWDETYGKEKYSTQMRTL